MKFDYEGNGVWKLGAWLITDCQLNGFELHIQTSTRPVFIDRFSAFCDVEQFLSVNARVKDA